MRSFSNENKDVEPALQLEERQLPIEEYAAKEGVSMPLIEECGRLGIVQIRNYDGRAFIVDVTVDCDVDEVKMKKDFSSVIDNVNHRSFQSADKPERAVRESSGSTTRVKSKIGRRIVKVFFIACFFAAVFGNFWLNAEIKTRLTRLNEATVKINELRTDSTLAGQQNQIIQKDLTKAEADIERLQKEIDAYRTKVERLQNDLAEARTEVKSVKSKLAKAQQNLTLAEHRNTMAAEKLNMQINKLTNKLAEVANNRRQQGPSSDISDK